jgi:hypothetical protein
MFFSTSECSFPYYRAFASYSTAAPTNERRLTIPTRPVRQSKADHCNMFVCVRLGYGGTRRETWSRPAGSSGDGTRALPAGTLQLTPLPSARRQLGAEKEVHGARMTLPTIATTAVTPVAGQNENGTTSGAVGGQKRLMRGDGTDKRILYLCLSARWGTVLVLHSVERV